MALPQAKHRLGVNDSHAKYRIRLHAGLNPRVWHVRCSKDNGIFSELHSNSYRFPLLTSALSLIRELQRPCTSCMGNNSWWCQAACRGPALFPGGRLRLKLSLSRLFQHRGLFTARAGWLAGSLLQVCVPFHRRKDENKRAEGSERRQTSIKMP